MTYFQFLPCIFTKNDVGNVTSEKIAFVGQLKKKTAANSFDEIETQFDDSEDKM